MKNIMIIFSVLSFAFATWATQSVVSDIQIIIVVVSVIGGGIFMGLAGVMYYIEEHSSRLMRRPQ